MDHPNRTEATRRRPRPADPVTIALGAAAVGALVLGLTGCTAMLRVLQHEHEESFAGYQEASEGWVGVGIPAWIPEDARDLRNLATTDEQAAVIRVTSPTTPLGCVSAARRGLPALTADWTPADLPAESWPADVLACGEYEVMPVADGWLGWFNATEPGDIPGA